MRAIPKTAARDDPARDMDPGSSALLARGFFEFSLGLDQLKRFPAQSEIPLGKGGIVNS